MKKLMLFVMISLISFGIVGCSNMNNSDVGTITGGVIGGLVGSRFGHGSGRMAATAVGAVAGAFIGSRIGQSMDQTDKMKMNQALESDHSNHVTSWHNPDNGNTYTVKPTRTYHRRHSTQPCRDYTTTAIIGGKKQVIYGHACRMADGTWKVQN